MYRTHRWPRRQRIGTCLQPRDGCSQHHPFRIWHSEGNDSASTEASIHIDARLDKSVQSTQGRVKDVKIQKQTHLQSSSSSSSFSTSTFTSEQSTHHITRSVNNPASQTHAHTIGTTACAPRTQAQVPPCNMRFPSVSLRTPPQQHPTEERLCPPLQLRMAICIPCLCSTNHEPVFMGPPAGSMQLLFLQKRSVAR